MKVVILSPRLDIPFKDLDNGHVPDYEGLPNSPLRVHWDNFVKKLNIHHEYRCDDVRVIKKPLWQFTPDLVENLDADLVYIPHKNNINFPVKNRNVRYYMQTVFPEYFTVDRLGWGAKASFVEELTITKYPNGMDAINTQPFNKQPDISEYDLNQWFDNFKKIYTSRSKFEQPNNTINEKGYILFLCQIPHDETIKFHSRISVFDALRITLEYCKVTNKKIIVKGHPVNPGSMSELRELTSKFQCATWVDNLNIHEAIKNCSAAVTVNSGSGFEVILHEKPLISFGYSEYSKIVPICGGFWSCMDLIFRHNETGFEPFQIDKYRKWMYWFIQHCVDSRDINTYKRIIF